MAVVGALPLVEVAHVWANPIGWLMRGGGPLIGGGLGSLMLKGMVFSLRRYPIKIQ